MMQQRLRSIQPVPPPATAPSPDVESLTWVDVHRFARRFGGAIVMAAVLFSAMGWLIAMSRTPTFVATTLVLIESRLPQALREQLGEATLVLDSPAIESQIAILKSRSIAAGAIAKLGYTPANNPFYSDAPGRLSRLKAVIGLSAPHPSTSDPQFAIDRLIEEFQGNLEVRRSGLSYVLEISFASTSAAEAAQIVNTVADVYLSDQLNQKVDAVRQATEWRDEQIVKIRQLMNRSARAVQEFKARRDYRILPTDTQAAIGDQKPPATPPSDAELREPTTLEELEVTAQAYRKVYENNLQVHADLAQRQFLQFTNARVITKASVPAVAAYPRIGLITAIAGLAGMILAMSAALIHSSFDTTVSLRRDVQTMTGLSCLADIASAEPPRASLLPALFRSDQQAAPPRLSYIDIVRMHATIEQTFPRVGRRTLVITGVGDEQIAAAIATRLAEHYRSTGEKTLLIADHASSQRIGISATDKPVFLVKADPLSNDVDLIALSAQPDGLEVQDQRKDLVPLLGDYDVIVVLVASEFEDYGLGALMREASAHLIVAERRVASRVAIRAVANRLSANANKPPYVVLAGRTSE